VQTEKEETHEKESSMSCKTCAQLNIPDLLPSLYIPAENYALPLVKEQLRRISLRTDGMITGRLRSTSRDLTAKVNRRLRDADELSHIVVVRGHGTDKDYELFQIIHEITEYDVCEFYSPETGILKAVKRPELTEHLCSVLNSPRVTKLLTTLRYLAEAMR
jgi:hypothetical protein